MNGEITISKYIQLIKGNKVIDKSPINIPPQIDAACQEASICH